ncbi:MAG: gliding motility-associated C-terminal domain-containing protein [Bacteroidales bacterium]|nr:gliding motility-associated C-terminal domain-containing protein [Bacteroidales bacterium]
MRYPLKIIIALLLIANSFSGISQISSPNADNLILTKYTDIGQNNDPIFVYYSPPGTVKTPNLIARAPENHAFTFEWYMFDSLALNWNLIVSTPGVTESSLTPVENGGYKVRAFDGISIDTTFHAWIFINHLEVNVLSNSSDQLVFGKYFCGKLILDATIKVDPFWYYNPVSFERTDYVNDRVFQWTTDHPVFKIKPDNIGLSEKGVLNPPAEDMWIILTATDSTGMTDVDSVFYETVEVNADFSMEFFDKVETEDYIEAPNPTEDDAPLKIRFTNTSLNGYTFEWIFTDTSNYYITDPVTEITENIDYKPEFTYKIPDHYYPALVARSYENCIDTLKLIEPIVVFPSELEAPNVFSPEGTEKNKYFKVTFQSIKEFHIRIYSRTGNLVYKADITDLHNWDGWDGNILNSNRPASAGVYYYIIEATGYDEIQYNRGPYKGFVYLFRPK